MRQGAHQFAQSVDEPRVLDALCETAEQQEEEEARGGRVEPSHWRVGQ